jgi:hypothetical protein
MYLVTTCGSNFALFAFFSDDCAYLWNVGNYVFLMYKTWDRSLRMHSLRDLVVSHTFLYES